MKGFQDGEEEMLWAALYLVLWKEGQPAWSKLGVKGLGGEGGTQHQKGYVGKKKKKKEMTAASTKGVRCTQRRRPGTDISKKAM